MKIIMRLEKYKKCKLWINEPADGFEVEVEKTIEKSLAVCNKKYRDRIKIAIELSLPRNASNYAFIGCEFIPDEVLHNKIDIIVCINNKSSSCTNKTLAQINDKVFLGISEEYGDGILETVIQSINEIDYFPAGKVIFNLGAYAECGSSRAYFLEQLNY